MRNSTFKHRFRLHLPHNGGGDLARFLNTPRSTIHGWLCDPLKAPRDFETIKKIADYLGVNAPYLMGWIDYPGKNPYSLEALEFSQEKTEAPEITAA